MISPNDLDSIEKEKLDYQKLENQIDESIKKFHGWYPWEEAVIEGEYSITIRNEIAKQYKEAGWTHVYHRTTSEAGEKAGLTSFKFSMEPLKPEYIEHYHTV